jgi:hypothetical protein
MKFLLQVCWIGAAVGAERLPQAGASGANYQHGPASGKYLLPGITIGDTDSIEP